MERILVVVDHSGSQRETMRVACHLMLIRDYHAKPDESILAADNILSVLESSECPVFVSPITTCKLSEIVFTYDGSPSSVFAIKQFTHLFPELKYLPVTLLEVKSHYTYEIDFGDNIKRYLRTHYRHLNICTLKGEPGDELFPFLPGKNQMYINKNHVWNAKRPGN